MVDSHSKSLFFRSLSTLLESGVSLLPALESLAQQGQSAVMAEQSSQLAQKLQQGHALSQCMRGLPHTFRAREWSLIRVAERSGLLVRVIAELGNSLEAEHRRHLELRKMLMTPAITAVLCLVIAMILPPLALKGLLDFLCELHIPLPWTTRVLLGWSALVSSPWTYAVLALGFLLGRAAVPKLSAFDWQESLLTKIPVVNSCYQLWLVTGFLHCFRQTVQVGMPLLEAVRLSQDSLASPYASRQLDSLQARLREGDSLAEAFAACDFFPTCVGSSLKAAEENGQILAMLNQLISLFEQDLQTRMQFLAATLEPLVMLWVGCAVGFMLIATLQPTLSLLEAL